MNKILFIVPPYVSFKSYTNPSFNDGVAIKESGRYKNYITDVPMGLISMSAYLRKYAKVEIKIIDFNIILKKINNFKYVSFSELFNECFLSKEIIDFQPDIIGISALFTPLYHNMIDTAEAARSIFPDAIIIGGGGVPSFMYKTITKDTKCFDALCYGEGEKPLLGLMLADNKKEFLKKHSSWITEEKIENELLFQYDFIENLDEIPFFAYDLINMDDYKTTSLLSTFPLAKDRMNSVSVLTSRGCPHLCCFCASHITHGRKMRYHSIARVREDFKRLYGQYGAKTIVFFDDHLMGDKNRFLEIVEIMNNFGMTPFFPSSLALYALDRKVLEALKNIGVNQLVLSVESGSNRVLKEIMRKPLDLSIVKRVISDCRELSISSDVAILIGLPGETKQDIEDTRVFLKTLNATWFRINIATPLMGSEMFDICLENNYIKGDDCIDCDYKKAIVETGDFTTQYIQEKVYSLNLELNFALNSDFRLGNYEIALMGFENTLRVKNDHALALYFSAKCCKEMNLNEKYLDYKKRYESVIKESEFWRNYVNQFNLSAF